MKNKRESGIELLKIFAMLMIICSHSIPYSESLRSVYGEAFIDITCATTNISDFIMIIFKYLGQLGNAVFVICSAWFLTNSKRVKPEKVIEIVLDSFLISIGILLLFIISGQHIETITFIKQIFPITFQNFWFVSCYLLLYSIHPLLNIIIDSVTQRQLLRIVLIMLILYSGISFVLVNKYYYSHLVGFILIYFMTAYMKKYMPKISTNKKYNIRLFLASLIGLIVMLAVTDGGGLKIDVFSHMMLRWCIFTNPFILGMAISLFNIFRHNVFYNFKINYLSSLTLIVYMLHENPMICNNIKPMYFVYMVGCPILKSLILVLITAILSFALAALYMEILKKPIKRKIIPFLHKIAGTIFMKAEDIIIKLH